MRHKPYLNKFFILKLIYFLVVLFLFSSTILFVVIYSDYFKYQPIKAYYEDVFASSLNLVFCILGFLIVVVIFLFQQIGQKHNPDIASKLPITSKYFFGTFAIMIVFAVFNMYCIYFKVAFPYTLISLTSSICILLLIFFTVAISFQYLNFSAVLLHLSNEVIAFINKKKSFKSIPLFGAIGYTDAFVDTVKNRTSVFVKSAIEAINNDQDSILETSLHCIQDISQEYLEQSKHCDVPKDIFIEDLNDQFDFITAAALTSYNQKNLELIASVIGDISVLIVENRKGIGDNHTHAIIWLNTLANLFHKAYPLSRTVACQVALKRISQASLVTLDLGYHSGYENNRHQLDRVAVTLSTQDGHWSAVLLQQSLFLYQEHFIEILKRAISEPDSFYESTLKNYFRQIEKIINTAKKWQRSYLNTTTIFMGLYGMQSLNLNIAHSGIKELKNDEAKTNLAICLKELISFTYNVASNEIAVNDDAIYDSYSEMLYIICRHADLKDEDRHSLLLLMSDNVLRLFRDIRLQSLKPHESTSREIDIDSVIIDYFAVLIYLHQNRLDNLDDIFKQYLLYYQEMKPVAVRSGQEYQYRSLYRELKLISCWLSIFSSANRINETLIEVLKQDLPPSDVFQGLSIPSLMKEHGYPEYNRPSDGMWYLRPSYIWGNSFQNEIKAALNGNGDHYVEFDRKIRHT